MSRKLLCALVLVGYILASGASVTYAQTPTRAKNPISELSNLATDSALFASEAARLASPSADEIEKLEAAKKEDITQPEQPEQRGEIFELFAKRPVQSPGITNFLAFTVQTAIAQGLPANTIILILLLPFLASGIAFVRHILGLPTLGILVPLALSITLVATGIASGLLLLAIVLLGTMIARVMLKKIRIMHMPKLALSMLLLSLIVFGALVTGAFYGVLSVKKLSIFPVLLMILLSERLMSLQLERQFRDMIVILFTNIVLGILGFFILSSQSTQNLVLLYPELIFLLIPINIAVGRYFGLRVTEIFRFHDVLER